MVVAQHKYFRVEDRGGFTVITPTVADCLNQVTNVELKRELVDFARLERPDEVVVNFQHVLRFSTEFIGSLLSVKKVLGGDRRIRLCGMEPHHLEVFQLLNLVDTVFDVYETVEDACRG